MPCSATVTSGPRLLSINPETVADLGTSLRPAERVHDPEVGGVAAAPRRRRSALPAGGVRLHHGFRRAAGAGRVPDARDQLGVAAAVAALLIVDQVGRDEGIALAAKVDRGAMQAGASDRDALKLGLTRARAGAVALRAIEIHPVAAIVVERAVLEGVGARMTQEQTVVTIAARLEPLDPIAREIEIER